jgi:hypothetical protein
MKTLKHPDEVHEVLSHLKNIRGDVPFHRRESKRLYSFSNLIWPLNEQLAFWDELWHIENDFWIRVHCFFFLERHIKETGNLIEMWPIVVN